MAVVIVVGAIFVVADIISYAAVDDADVVVVVIVVIAIC